MAYPVSNFYQHQHDPVGRSVRHAPQRGTLRVDCCAPWWRNPGTEAGSSSTGSRRAPRPAEFAPRRAPNRHAGLHRVGYALAVPVTIGEGAMVAAGSVITEDVTPDALAIARGKQVEKPGRAAAFRAKRTAAKQRTKR